MTGPASTNEDILVEMMRAGMRIARLNFSHGSHAEHADRIKTIRRAMKLYQDRYNHPCPLGIALDTKGPEIRTGIIEQVSLLILFLKRILAFWSLRLSRKEGSSSLIWKSCPLMDISL